MQSRNSSNIKIIDVSHHQEDVDWPAVAKTDIKGAMIKATEGVGYIDPKFRRNAVGAPAAGLKVGFYHYARPDTNTALQDAQNFIDAIKGLPADLPHALDFEEGKAKPLGKEKLTEWAVTWLKEVEKQTKHPVMFYTYTDYARSYCGPGLGAFTLWIAHYGVNQPGNNDTWSTWSMFQYSSSGTVSGISGNTVDMNEMDLNFWNNIFAEPGPFPDVEKKRWSAEAIEAMETAGIMTGYPDGTFKPGEVVTREELASALSILLREVKSK